MAALTFSFDTLRTGGHFLCKFYQGPEDKEFETKLKRLFTKVHREKPESSRSVSRSRKLTCPISVTNRPRDRKRRTLLPCVGRRLRLEKMSSRTSDEQNKYYPFLSNHVDSTQALSVKLTQKSLNTCCIVAEGTLSVNAT